MLSLLRSPIHEISFNGILKAGKQKVPNYVYRDELDKKPSTRKLKKRADGEAKALLQREKGQKKFEQKSNGCIEEREGLRVKILMTKEEAARLLSKCKAGGVLEFKDVAKELVGIPTSRVKSEIPSS
ncbi:hypothetical protein F0562_035517 [Nyssa sinensis]|uniref:DUF7890 domain-containing protein n=1 Tax=Nyssa sinensis TaxID=561372 RepID=A0A5J5AED0_9ASTE|nr:hypothetical protein F0562_035517 [Nyssa sinensis]